MSGLNPNARNSASVITSSIRWTARLDMLVKVGIIDTGNLILVTRCLYLRMHPAPTVIMSRI